MPVSIAPPTARARRRARLRLAAAAVLLLALVAAALAFPSVEPGALRSWVAAVGPVAAVLFLLGHAIVTVAPVPRTVFTLSAGVLFGPALGIVLSLVATTLSALLAFLLVRAVGRDVVAPWLGRGALRRVDARLGARGWAAVASLRLIPPVPFAPLNYASALSSIRLRHFLAGTAVGIIPGSVAVVLLGDALTGATSPALLVVSACCAAVGVVGLVLDARTPVRGSYPG